MSKVIVILVVALSSCNCLHKSKLSQNDIIIIKYQGYNIGGKYMSLYYNVLDANIKVYQCKHLTKEGLCFESDSLIANWIFKSKYKERFEISAYNYLDSSIYELNSYNCFFRNPYRLKKFINSGKKDTLTIYRELINRDSLLNRSGIISYERVILDSFFISSIQDTVFVIKTEYMTITSKDSLYADFDLPKIYHINGKGILYYEAELINYPDHYFPLLEIIDIKKIKYKRWQWEKY